MNINRTLLLVALVAIASGAPPALAFDSGLAGVSQNCLLDCELADRVVSQVKSAEPLLALQKKYTNEVEKEEAAKRVTNESSGSQAEIMETLGNLSPDSNRAGIIREWLKSENKRPWP
jgi:hypothetical protein